MEASFYHTHVLCLPVRMRWFASLMVFLAGCAHTGALEDGVLHKDGVAVRLGPVPRSWERIRVDGADVAYRDQQQQGSALFDLRCNGRDGDAPLSALTQHLIMGTTERDFVSEDTVPFDGREALHTVLSAKLDGVPMQYDIFVMKKDGCVYDLVYVAPPDHFKQGASDFERFAGALHAESPPLSVGATRPGSSDP